jgi:cytoskeleton protein RodZ
MSLSELGAYLQRHREEQGLSLETLEEVTRIRRVHLEAIEAGRWDDLPPGVYVRGLLKSYAKTVGLNPETVQRMHRKEQPQDAQRELREVLSRPLLREPRLSMETILTMVFIGAAAVIGWWLWQTFVGPMLSTPSAATPTAAVSATVATGSAGPSATPPRAAGTATRPVPTALQAVPLVSGTPEGSPTSPTSTAAGTPIAGGAVDAGSTPATAAASGTGTRAAASATPRTATATAPRASASPERATPGPSPTAGRGSPTASAAIAAGGLRIAVQSKGSVWLRVFVDGGSRPAYEGFLKQGENERWEGQATRSISLRTGNAGDTEVSLNGQRLPALGKAGEVKNVEWRLLPDGRVQQTP